MLVQVTPCSALSATPSLSAPVVSLTRNGFSGYRAADEDVSNQYVIAPPRLNFAGFCDYCLERGCQSPGCIARYESARWTVCDKCEGTGLDDIECVCGFCFGGMLEVHAGYTGFAVRGREAVRP